MSNEASEATHAGPVRLGDPRWTPFPGGFPGVEYRVTSDPGLDRCRIDIRMVAFSTRLLDFPASGRDLTPEEIGEAATDALEAMFKYNALRGLPAVGVDWSDAIDLGLRLKDHAVPIERTGTVVTLCKLPGEDSVEVLWDGVAHREEFSFDDLLDRIADGRLELE